MKLTTGMTVCSCFLIGLWSPCYAGSDEGDVGCYKGDVLPADADPAWILFSGKADEAIVDGKWVVRGPENFCRSIDFGQIARREGQENVVEIRWATTCPDNHSADGFRILAQGRRLRLHPLDRPDGRDILLTGTPHGMRPDIAEAIVDLSGLPQFDAAKPNTYRIRWVTNAKDTYGFEVSVNGKSIGRLPGMPHFDPAGSSMALELRAGTHTVDQVRWTLNRGGRPIADKALLSAQRLLNQGARQLFLDDVMIERMDNLARVVNQPRKHRENPIIRHGQTPWQTYRTQLYGTALYDPQQRRLKMWYLAVPRLPHEDPITLDGRRQIPNFQLVGYAESADGLHFDLPNLGLVDFNGSTENNICRIGQQESAEGIAVVHDRHDPDPQRRYKALYWEHGESVNGMSVSFSADGKDWTYHDGNPAMGYASDTGQQALWDPNVQKYVAYGRFGNVGRRVARSESGDFVHWSEPRLVLQSDDQDDSGTAAIYGMGVSLYEGVYIGMPWILHQGTTYKIDVQLATSRDGINWTRVGDRQTFIPNGPAGSWDAGIVETAAQPAQIVGDQIYIYYSASRKNHDYRNPPDPGTTEFDEHWEGIKTSIGVATLRRDGFVSLSAGDRPGTLVTKTFTLPKGKLFLNTDASATEGEVGAALLDEAGALLAESQPVRGDRLRAAISFASPTPQPGTQAKLKITARNARLYSYWFETGQDR